MRRAVEGGGEEGTRRGATRGVMLVTDDLDGACVRACMRACVLACVRVDILCVGVYARVCILDSIHILDRGVCGF